MNRLNDKVVLVTGAACGIGRATARLFAEEGARVVAVDVDGVALEENIGDIAGCECVPADVTNPGSVSKVVSRASQRYGRIDGLAHYAGITRDAIHWKMGLESFEEVVRVNLTGTFVVAQAVSAILRENGGGSMVLTASRVYLGNVGQANYSASKGAVVSLGRTLALELARFNVRVNILAPGFIDTRMTRAIPAELRERAIQAIPLQRVGKPEDVARASLFLLSDDAKFITGQVLFVDGGRTIGTAPA